MSLHPTPTDPVPTETVRVAHAAFPRGNRYLQMRDVLGAIYTDADFAALFDRRGQPAETPWRLALVTVMQFAEGLSDRQAAEAVRARIDWKDALGLELTDPGFNFSVLSEFRGRLVAEDAAEILRDRLLHRCQDQGLLKARGRQRTDATHVLGLLRELNRLEWVGETLRAALEAVAVAAPSWLQRWVPAAWATRYGHRLADDRLPKEVAARQIWSEQVGADGQTLLTALAASTAPPELATLPPVVLLQEVWAQQFTPADAAGRVALRPVAELPAAAAQIETPYEPEARHGVKRGHGWTGSKVHLTETCDDDRPHLLTQVTTTIAPAADLTHLADMHALLAERDLLPAQQLVEAGYVSGQTLVTSRTEYAIELLGPIARDPHWQAQTATGYALADFQVDWPARVATCPRGCHSTGWSPYTTASGRSFVRVSFAAADCTPCPARAACTRAATAPRGLTLLPQAEHEAVHMARQRQATTAFQDAYARRAGMEGTISQGVRALGLRRARYRGLAKLHVQHVATAAAINLQRIDAWCNGDRPAPTRHSRFAALVAA